ncbi:MAG: hypothetical protein ACR2QB_09080 [Gammaproteobacteria bacterium]
MGEPYSLWLFLHLLLFVYWLGADLGVFVIALTIRNPKLPVAQRIQLMHLSLAIDLVPRAAFASIAPVGLILASGLGLVSIPAIVLILAWLIAFAWIIGEVIAYRHLGEPLAIRIYMFTGGLMAIQCLVFLGFGLSSLLSGWPFAPTWLALKIFLFGCVFLVSVLMAVFYAPLEGIFQRMAASGSSPELEKLVCSHVNRGAVVTVVMFGLLAGIAFLGQAKPL